ncbi:MAB_1171c family putative transporter [Actinomadura yumaensis]|uniref:MAB_1171c family putative transporter n=1 Tax=Actinomadura yumaensis TaxID=111807 RepID=UPI003622B60A
MIGALMALLYTLPRLVRHPTEVAVVAVCVYFASSFLSFFLGLDFVWPSIADLFGYRNITTILIHCTVVVLTAAQQVVLINWSYPLDVARTKARKRVASFGAMLILLVAMFVFALPPRRHDAETASLLNMENSRYVTYLCVYIGVVAVGQIITMRLSVHYAGIVGRAWLRRGMWIVVTGAGFILVYCAMRYVEIIGVQSGADMTRWDPLQWLAGDVGSLLELVGWTIPGWGPWLSHVHRWTGDYRAYRQLYPLWTALYEAAPMIAKEPPALGWPACYPRGTSNIASIGESSRSWTDSWPCVHTSIPATSRTPGAGRGNPDSKKRGARPSPRHFSCARRCAPKPTDSRPPHPRTRFSPHQAIFLTRSSG